MSRKVSWVIRLLAIPLEAVAAPTVLRLTDEVSATGWAIGRLDGGQVAACLNHAVERAVDGAGGVADDELDGYR